ncbi:hypothetical protein BDL97_06G019100 [Sphagnum fallax]|nr:hypothetical protein BDL97_06G019100 [Sphagnum fallax]
MAVLSRISNIVTLLKQHVIVSGDSAAQENWRVCSSARWWCQVISNYPYWQQDTNKIVVGGRLRSIFPPCPNIRSLCIAAHLYMCGHSMLCIHVICSKLLFL